MHKLDELKETVRILRSENGCPWDRKQTLYSLKKNIVEEAAEVVGALNVLKETERKEFLAEELGDLLLQVVMEAQIAQEQGLFTLDDLIAGVNEKMILRHPYIFECEENLSKEEANERWQQRKSREKKGTEWIEPYTVQGFREAGDLLSAAQARKNFLHCDAQRWIERLHMQKHPEGGWFVKVYTADPKLGTVEEQRPIGGSIYFLLEGNDVSHFHVIDTDEIWYAQEGNGVRMYFIDAAGTLSEHLLGTAEGMEPMVVVPKGIIFGAECVEEKGYELMSCVTLPAFRYEGFRLVPQEEMMKLVKDRRELVERLAFKQDSIPVVE